MKNLHPAIIRFSSFVLLLLLSFANYSNAQVGIGTTTPHSTLDVRGSVAMNYRAFTTSTVASSTDHTLMFTGTAAATVTLPDATLCTGREYIIKNASGTLPAPLITITGNSGQTIDGAATALIDETNESLMVSSNGTSWNILGASSPKTRINYVLVKSVTDLPVPVAGVINLVAGVTYEINGTIMLSNKINLNGCYLVGMDANNDKLIYTPGSGELFTGTKGGTVKTLTLAAITTGSKLFNLNLDATENLIFRDNVVANCKEIGVVQGGYIIFFSIVNFASNLNGITFSNCNNLLLDNLAWFPTNSNTFEKYIGTFNVIEKLGGFSQPMITNAAVAMDVSGITSINEAANFKNTAMMGTGTRVFGSFSGKWEVEAPGIATEKDDVAAGNIYLTSALQSNFTGANIPVKVSGTTATAALFRVSSTVNNRLTYTGIKNRRFAVIASLSVTAQAANKNFSFYIYKNGIRLPESEQAMRLSTGVDKGSITLSCTVQMVTGDYIEIWGANTSDASSMTVETLNLSIK